tara:strand:+ start:399 stop:563 length:165 start_codon:yes stop_codon:yes gene_type:complete
MNITSAKYRTLKGDKTIKATIDGVETIVPLYEGNRHYDEIQRQVNAGTLTIEAE